MSMSYELLKLSQSIVIKNSTNEELNDIYLVFDGLTLEELKIKKLDKHSKVVENVIISESSKPINILLYYYKNNVKKEIVIDNNLDSENLKTIEINIIKNGDKLEAKVKTKKIDARDIYGTEFFVYAFFLLVITLVVLGFISNFL